MLDRFMVQSTCQSEVNLICHLQKQSGEGTIIQGIADWMRPSENLKQGKALQIMCVFYVSHHIYKNGSHPTGFCCHSELVLSKDVF